MNPTIKKWTCLLISRFEHLDGYLKEAFQDPALQIDSVQELGVAFQKLKQQTYDFILLEPNFVLVNATDTASHDEEQIFIQLGVKAVFYKEPSQWLKLREYIEGYSTQHP